MKFSRHQKCISKQLKETDRENRLLDMGRGEERVRCMERVTWKQTLPYVNRWPTGICCMSQETQTGALYQPRGVGWRERFKGGIYVYLQLIPVEV